eukprot:scaffold33036_cov35-Prasinocladus_malaysianus.AAC.3
MARDPLSLRQPWLSPIMSLLPHHQLRGRSQHVTMTVQAWRSVSHIRSMMYCIDSAVCLWEWETYLARTVTSSASQQTITVHP